jgi:branched-chain amino acid transport system ATP-binding protein
VEIEIMPLLSVKSVSKSFGGLAVLSVIDFDVQEKEIVGLIGPNGSGKTTLFNTITGSLPCDSGTIFFCGEEITGLKPHRICQKGIGKTFQLTRPFLRMTCLENVMVGRFFGRGACSGYRQAKAEARDILVRVGLQHKELVPAAGLNVIGRKRLELARALAGSPQLLLLDEIMAGLNPMEITAAVGLIRQIHESGVSVVIVEHVMKALLSISERVVVLDAGRKIAEGTPQEIVKDEGVIRAYLGQAVHA